MYLKSVNSVLFAALGVHTVHSVFAYWEFLNLIFVHPYPKWPNSNVHLKQHGQNFPYTVLLEHLEVTDKKFLFEKDSFSCTNLKSK